MEYFISDTHFGHKSTLFFENNPRPFNSIYEMNEKLIENWNSIVGVNDIVYHAGDFAYKCSKSSIRTIFGRLNGKIIFIPGNHDGLTLKINQSENRFESTHRWMSIELYGFKVFICHFPVYSWDQKERGSIHLHGHIHSGIMDFSHTRMYNVCADINQFKPISFFDILSKLRISK